MATSYEIKPQFSSSTRSDAQGAWGMDTGESVSPGYHTVVLTGEDGQQTDAPLYVVKGEDLFVVRDQPMWLDRIQYVLPPLFAYVILGLAILLAAVTLFLLWLGGRADRAVPGSKRRFKKYAIIFVTTTLVIAGIVAILLNRRVREEPIQIPALGYAPVQTETIQTVQVQGKIVALESRAPVSGIDLAVGDTTVKTMGTGQFSFSNVRIGSAIRVTHPELKRAILYRIAAGGAQELAFDISLLNVVHEVVDRESRGQRDAQYSAFPDRLKQNLKRETYLSRDPLFSASNIGDQGITIGKISYTSVWESPVSRTGWKRVALVELWNGDRSAVYPFTIESGNWQLVQ